VSWQRVLGHDAQVKAFDRARRRGRLAHAYLLVGPAGVGKRLFAGELAKALLCETPSDTLAACDHCTACTLVDANTHPDLFMVSRPEGLNELPIELMRELCQGFGLKSARGRGKVAVLDDADDLNADAANCFLKTLEEPPPGSVFLLVGTTPERQLPTIVSRCQVVRFAPLSEETVLRLVQQHGVEDSGLAARLARLSGGSAGQALALADPDLWRFRRTLIDGLTVASPDTVGLARQWVEFAAEAGKEMAFQRRRAALVLRLLIDFLSEAVTLAVGGTPRLAEPRDLEGLRALVDRLDADTLLEIIDRCLEADTQIERYVQLALVLEGLLDEIGAQLNCGFTAVGGKGRPVQTKT
jgi:DNA polymerase-3 subunit delta'